MYSESLIGPHLSYNYVLSFFLPIIRNYMCNLTKDHNNIQGRRILCKSEGDQASIAIYSDYSYLEGSGGILPQENLDFSTLRECL